MIEWYLNIRNNNEKCHCVGLAALRCRCQKQSQVINPVRRLVGGAISHIKPILRES